jgi:glycerate dehydrogenase
MRIVLLDCHTLNPGDLSWQELETLGDCTFYERSRPEELLDRCCEADALLVNKVKMPGGLIEQLGKLRYIGVTATGYDVVDVEAARRRGIPVTNVPTYGTASVAQMVFAHLLNLTQRVAGHARTVTEGRWAACPDFCYWDYPLVELAGLTMGIVGFGRIGQATARIALALGMKVLASDVAAPERVFEGVEIVELDRLFRQSDVVTLHCPLTPETERLIDAPRLASMKRSAFLINTSRGGLVDERALAEALDRGQIAGAGLDVLSSEPPPPDHPLLGAPNCFITPHIAWATCAARQRLLDVVVQNLKSFIEGRPQNVVNY